MGKTVQWAVRDEELKLIKANKAGDIDLPSGQKCFLTL